MSFFFFQAEDGIRDLTVTGVQTCALPISSTFGPSPLAPAVRSIRDVEYSPPALHDDSAAVSTTKFTIPAAAGMPILVNASTNGLVSSSNSVQLITDRITSSDPR